MKYLKCLGVALAAGMLVAGAPPSAESAADTARSPANRLGSDPLWDDGRAEFSQYVGTTNRYGQDRRTESRIVIVKEDQLDRSLVKSDRGPVAGATREVLKIVFVAEFPTGSYFYRQAATTFVERSTLAMRKLVMSHFDGCGITTVRVLPRGDRWIHEAHSYWEDEADREVTIDGPSGERPWVWWDALPLWLRGALASGAVPPRVALLPGQVAGRSPIENTRPVEASLRASDGGTVQTPAGSFRTRLVTVTAGAHTDRFWFDAAYPHVLVRLETAAGRKLLLRKTQRLDYWRHHALGDEKLIR